MKDTIIFDMDGVIIDSEPLNLDILASLYEKVGIKVPEKEHLSSLGVASKDWWTHLKQNYQFDTPIEELMAQERRLVDEYIFSDEALKYIFKDVSKTIKGLKAQGFCLALASASAYPVINEVLRKAGLLNDFDLIVSATDKNIQRGKPYPDIYLFVADKLNVNPETCLVIEDSEQGLKAAKTAGMDTVCFLSAPVPINTENADAVFREYQELPKIVNEFI